MCLAAFQTIVALAEADQLKDTSKPAKIQLNHVEKVINLSREFQAYLKTLRRGYDEATWATKKNIRADQSGQKRGLGALKGSESSLTATFGAR